MTTPTSFELIMFSVGLSFLFGGVFISKKSDDGTLNEWILRHERLGNILAYTGRVIGILCLIFIGYVFLFDVLPNYLKNIFSGEGSGCQTWDYHGCTSYDE